MGSLVAVVLVATAAAVNQAIPSLAASSLHLRSSALLWVVDAYVVVFAALLLPAAALADRLGSRRALVSGLAVYVFGTAVCALAPDSALLLLGRGVAGLGASLALPTSLSVQLAVTDKARAPHVVAVWTAATAAGGVLGNTLGGVLVEWGGWRSLFIGLFPLAVLSLALAVRYTPAVAPKPRTLDLAGTALIVLAFVGLLAGLVEGPAVGWASGTVIAAFVAAVAGVIGYMAVSRRSAQPVIDPVVFTSPAARGAMLGIVASFVGLFGLFLSYGQFLQGVLGFGPALSGVAVVPAAAALVPASRLAPRFTARFGARLVAVGGLTVLAGGLVGVSFWGVGTHYAAFAGWLVVIGAGAGVAGPPLSHTLISALPPQRASTGAALNSATREVGSALGVAIVGSATASSFASHLPSGVSRLAGRTPTFGHALAVVDARDLDAVRTAFAHGSGVGLRIAAAALILATGLVAAWVPGRGASRAGRPGR